MSKKKAKQHKIDSFEALCNVVTTENIERLMVDFRLCLVEYAKFMEFGRAHEDSKEFFKGKTNFEILKFNLTWIDDGKNNMKSFAVFDKEGNVVIDLMKKN